MPLTSYVGTNYQFNLPLTQFNGNNSLNVGNVIKDHVANPLNPKGPEENQANPQEAANQIMENLGILENEIRQSLLRASGELTTPARELDLWNQMNRIIPEEEPYRSAYDLSLPVQVEVVLRQKCY